MRNIAYTRTGRNALTIGLMSHIAAILAAMMLTLGAKNFAMLVYPFSWLAITLGVYAELKDRGYRPLGNWRFYVIAAVTVFPFLGPLTALIMLYAFQGKVKKEERAGVQKASRGLSLLTFLALLILFVVVVGHVQYKDRLHRALAALEQAEKHLLNADERIALKEHESAERELDEAAKLINRVIERGPYRYRDEAYVLLGDVHLKKGNMGLAEEYYLKAAELGPDNQRAKVGLNKIKRNLQPIISSAQETKDEAEGDLMPEPRMWKVYKGDKEVLTVHNQPGPITSMAHPPPDYKPVMHPFLSAGSSDPLEEGKLRVILDKAKSLEEFLFLLEKNDYRVEELDLSRYKRQPSR